MPDSAENYSQSSPTIQNQLKGLIAQNLFNTNAYYQITNEQNPIYIRALRAFSDGSFNKYNIEEEKKQPVVKKKKKIIQRSVKNKSKK